MDRTDTLQASARLVSTDADAAMFWLSEGQAAAMAREHGPEASPLFKSSFASLFVSGYQMFDRLQVCDPPPPPRTLSCLSCRSRSHRHMS